MSPAFAAANNDFLRRGCDIFKPFWHRRVVDLMWHRLLVQRANLDLGLEVVDEATSPAPTLPLFIVDRLTQPQDSWPHPRVSRWLMS